PGRWHRPGASARCSATTPRSRWQCCPSRPPAAWFARRCSGNLPAFLEGRSAAPASPQSTRSPGSPRSRAYAIGWIKDLTGSTDWGMYFLASFTVIGALLVLRVPATLVNR
ncbi:hypothetical protein ACTMU2_32340, partial [Cupriavidus basilensis]